MTDYFSLAINTDQRRHAREVRSRGAAVGSSRGVSPWNLMRKRHLSPAGRHWAVSPLRGYGLFVSISQGLTPLAITCRASGTDAGRHRYPGYRPAALVPPITDPSSPCLRGTFRRGPERFWQAPLVVDYLRRASRPIA